MSWIRKLADLPWGYWILSLLCLTVLPAVAVLLLSYISNWFEPAAFLLLLLPVIPYQLGRRGTVRFTKKELSWVAAYLPTVGLFLVSLASVLIDHATGDRTLTSGMGLLVLLFLMGALTGNILLFLIGERITAKQQNIKRKRPTLRQWGALGCCVLAVTVICSVFSYFRSLDTIVLDYDDEQAQDMMDAQMGGYTGGYGWRYENGWSSVDLRPYYVENEDNLLAKLAEPSDLVISDASQMPVLDGAEAAYPVYSAFANACYENIAEIQRTAKENDTARPIAFTNTVEAYKSLIAGDVDIFFGAKPSQAQLALAEEAGAELELTPIGKEAFVFFVSEENPVDGLSSEQIRDIYSGKTNNWLFLGGGLKTILAFQRPENSGSQTMMQYFMGDVPLREPLEYEYNASMVGVIREVAEYRNDAASIGYSFRYYASQMVFDGSDGIKFLELDGVYPSEENIRSGSYPMTTELYAITVKGNENPNVKPFVEWMTGEQGQRIVMNTGYTALGAGGTS